MLVVNVPWKGLNHSDWVKAGFLTLKRVLGCVCVWNRISSTEIKSNAVDERKTVKGFEEGLEFFKTAEKVFSLV